MYSLVWEDGYGLIILSSEKKMNSLNLSNKKITILKIKIGFSYSRIDNAVFQFKFESKASKLVHGY